MQYKYCLTIVDEKQKTFRGALRRSLKHKENECWLNTLYDYYGKTLLSKSKAKNKITRETILEVLGRTEENITEGLTIQEVLPFFQKCKLKLRVLDVFYNVIFKHDPEVPNFNHQPLYCVADGDHIYTLNKDLNSLAHNAKTSDFEVFANTNFRIP